MNDSTAPLRGARLFVLTFFISLATFMEVLDMTIVNVSVPAIAGSLGVSPHEGTWSISSYAMAAACMQPLTGWLGRRYGEVHVFITCTVLFIVCSILCGFAYSMPMLVVGRLLQGAVSGPMVPMAQAILLRNYPPEKRTLAMAIWAIVIFVAPVCGPVLGGWITENWSWPWLFYINVPVGIVCVVATLWLLHGRESERVAAPIDFTGLLLLIAGVGALQFVLDNGNNHEWFHSPMIVTCSVIAAVSLIVLVAWELTDKHPVLDLHLFAHRNFNIALAVICFGFASFFSAVVLYPLWLQTTVGYNAIWAGIVTAPVGITGLLMLPLLGIYMARANVRVLASFGVGVLGVSMLWMSHLTAEASAWDYVMPRLLQGIGLACFFMPLQQIMFSDVREHEFAAASGLSNCLRTLASSMSTALCVYIWSERTDFHHATLAGQLHRDGRWDQWSGQLAAAADDSGTLGITRMALLHQAQTLAVNDVMLLFGSVLLLLVPVVWLARPPFRGHGPAGH